MATYSPGTNEDHVIKTESVGHDLDLTIYIQSFKRIKSTLQSIPQAKQKPDQETLNHWNATMYEEGQERKILLDEQAVQLYNDVKPIKDAGLLPLKYNNEYQQLKNYIKSL